MKPKDTYLGESVTAQEVTNVLKDVRTLMKKNGNSKEDISAVEKFLLVELGANSAAELIKDRFYMHVSR